MILEKIEANVKWPCIIMVMPEAVATVRNQSPSGLTHYGENNYQSREREREREGGGGGRDRHYVMYWEINIQ